MRSKALTAVLGLIGLIAAACPATAAEVIHRERSLYQTILITESPVRLCMQFSVRAKRRSQSCMDPRQPKRLLFTYTRMTMAALLVQPEPARVLIAGLGGGTLPTALAELLPEVRIDVVEIDPAVVDAAREYFGFAATERVRVEVGDARVFVKRALARGERYDMVILDAFGGDYIPEHLMTVEFLDEARALLAPDAVLAANTFATSGLYDHESETYRAVFGMFFNFRVAESDNRVVIAANAPLPTKSVLRANAAAWAKRLRPYDVPIKEYPRSLSFTIDWDTAKRPLTDQYAPANLLQGNLDTAPRAPE